MDADIHYVEPNIRSVPKMQQPPAAVLGNDIERITRDNYYPQPNSNEPSNGILSSNRTLVICISIIVIVLIVTIAYMTTKATQPAQQTLPPPPQKLPIPIRGGPPDQSNIDQSRNSPAHPNTARPVQSTHSARPVQSTNNAQYMPFVREKFRPKRQTPVDDDSDEDDFLNHTPKKKPVNIPTVDPSMEPDSDDEEDADDVKHGAGTNTAVTGLETEIDDLMEQMTKKSVMDDQVPIPKYVKKEANAYDDEGVRILLQDTVRAGDLIELFKTYHPPDFTKFMGTKKMKPYTEV